MGPKRSTDLAYGVELLEGSVDVRQLLERALSEDHEAPEAASRCQAQQVQPVHVGALHPGDVAHGAGDAVVLVVDHLGMDMYV